ncbi:MAG: 3-hydroxyacyl-CoA dehydrogenase family protein [Solirubrobacterales bacterium]|nr:3-hydroxyacyl-CoA dehydrogenase family protein [Solirubrobacterales bacterium]MCB8971453.1 3-hydroxyacyl-CoA dehydrogenase family protein [Thermoleophilales bacterium]MCO5327135.1 3-hydroxyacyl-CoA dehydrogenase family protein [Solirubrobacterales bacterium]
MSSTPSNGYLSPGVAGTGAIALGVAAVSSTLGEVRVLARSDASAWKAEESAVKLCSKLEGGDPKNVKVTTEAGDLAGCDLVVEAIVEDADAKVELLSMLGEACPDADLATTTSSLSVGDLGERSGAPERFFGLHVFNPVTRMELIELCLPDGLREGAAERARAFCAALGKHAVEVPDHTGFVVNRLLFPYLFEAVRLMEDLDLSAKDVDDCMAMGTGQPMGPLKLLDFVGIDVAVAIGESLHEANGHDHHHPPKLLLQMESEGKLGRKSGEGFYSY